MAKKVSEAQDYNKELLAIAEGIRRYISYGGGSDGVTVSMTKSIAEALADFIEERCHQEPVKPERRYVSEPDKRFDKYRCTACGDILLRYRQHYCGSCGRELMWDAKTD